MTLKHFFQDMLKKNDFETILDQKLLENNKKIKKMIKGMINTVEVNSIIRLDNRNSFILNTGRFEWLKVFFLSFK